MSQVARHWRVSVVITLAALCTLLIAPATAVAQEAREPRADIRIVNDAEFDEAHGVRSGTGTVEDPFVISGWELNSLFIKDTNAAVLITDNTVRGTMTLDWIGRNVTVVDNAVGDLRVNQNVRRTGLPTSGLISNNTFDLVGQLRHWDGEFSHNVVGQPHYEGPVDDLLNEFFVNRAVNFDGFNGAVFTQNEIYGYVDVRIHGHHHSSAWGENSHDHGESHDDMDHTQRYHEVFFHHNRITVPAGTHYALGYQDNGHAGNDRTATSETNPALNDPHVHYTKVHLTDNVLDGSGLLVNVFNAKDERHITTSRGVLEIDRNTITLERGRYLGSGGMNGIQISQAEDVDVYVRDNNIFGPGPFQPETHLINVNSATGISMNTIDKALIRIYDNHVSDVDWGVHSSSFSDSVRWLIGGLHTENVEEEITSSGVANDWEPRPAEEETPDDGTTDDGDGHDGHDHGGH